MIERLLAAEAALDRGELEAAARLFGQVADADARNAIAVVGLARVASIEGRFDDARELLDRALTIDPAEAAARRLLLQLGGADPGRTGDAGAAGGEVDAVAETRAPSGPGAEPAWPAPAPEPWTPPIPTAARPRPSTSLWARLRRLLGLGGRG
jgi:tetratricopeptide (TPR) repeat protein